ncbi:MAG: acetyl-CoA carboxylase, carboxyltransferase subunit beta [Myxococcales bacterium]|nr:acetyl-CoA carboxylase, carboxyltransferase subunit beta [Myxococcales bacterium]
MQERHVAWFKRLAAPKVKGDQKTSVPSGLWRLCDACGASSLAEEVYRALETCPHCGRHFRMTARNRLSLFLDEGTLVEEAGDLSSGDPLAFTDTKSYKKRVEAAQAAVGERDAFLLAGGCLVDRPLVAGAFEFRFLGGSMGSVVGEKVTRAFELGRERQCPVVIFSASGGARMQEGILSLMQMAKTSAAIARFRHVGQPYISVLTDPTTGGVAASFAMLGDVILAEPNALVGFAGPRVIEQTIRQKLPDGFQRSEFLLDHGVIDQIVPRAKLRTKIARILQLLVGSPEVV